MKRRLPALLLTIAVAACAAAPAATAPGAPLSSTTTSAVAPTTTAAQPSTSTAAPTTTLPGTSTTAFREVDAEVLDPAGSGPHPAVVLVHGGSWVAGSPASLKALAFRLQGEGFLVVNARYTLASLRRPSFPAALDDIACAVRFAASHPESDGSVALIGHSAGAHLAAVVALTGDLYGEGCAHGPAVATRLVGLAGPYDVTRIGVLALPFFGSAPDDAPDLWAAANPLTLTEPGLSLRALLVHGADDSLVDARFAEDFLGALVDAGLTATMETIAGADHMEIVDPGVVGDLVSGWLETH